MTEQQIPKLAGKLVEHQNFFEALSTDNAQWAIQHPQEAIALFVVAITDRAKEVVQRLLEHVTTIKTIAVEKFVTADHFKEGETVEGVKTVSLSGNFKRLLIPKVEESVDGVSIRIHRLLRSSKDLGIRAEIGEASEEIKLAQFWQVLKSHGDGRIGDWLVSYIIGTDGNLWAVSACWCDDGWFLSASSVEFPTPWDAGYQVCSRDDS